MRIPVNPTREQLDEAYRQGMLRKEQLVHGEYYEGQCRNALQARWNAERQVFVHWRYKFGHKFVEEIRHPEDEQQYDVFVPEAICTTPDPIPDNQF